MNFSLEKALTLIQDQIDSQFIIDNYFDPDVLQAATRFWSSKEFEAIKTILHKYTQGRVKILDVGAGRGIATFAFTQEGFDVIALEPDSSTFSGLGAILVLSKNANLKTKITQGYGEWLPFREESFDVVYIRQVLHHSENLKKLCEETYRVLKPNGFLLATREHIITSKDDLETFLTAHPLHHLTQNENAFLLEDYINSIITAGFTIIKTWGPFDSVINYHPYSPDIQIFNLLRRKFYIPWRVWWWFNKVNVLSTYFRQLASKYDNTPGRLYSFLAKKT